MAKTMNKNKVLKLLELFPEIDGEIKSRRNFISDLEQYYNPIQGEAIATQQRENMQILTPQNGLH